MVTSQLLRFIDFSLKLVSYPTIKRDDSLLLKYRERQNVANLILPNTIPQVSMICSDYPFLKTIRMVTEIFLSYTCSWNKSTKRLQALLCIGKMSEAEHE
ncbi:CLUMA_CG013674, isoform A [Clunio marinus]|uniref:CLUMA_CG013674, isoform A n=1 Tax=Clunio marinus TaxID=568069 RepID=A0A1J1IJI6_9DIPT|nr:CLUMA_CG013674, isoform A [Clunio marinus]